MSESTASSSDDESTDKPSRKITRRLKKFADEYMTGVTGAEAVRRIGWKAKPNPDGSKPSSVQASNQASKIAYKYLHEPAVIEYMRERGSDLEKATGIRQERVLRRLNCIVEANPKNLIDDSGNLMPIQVMDDDIAASLCEVEYETVKDTDDKGKRIYRRVVKRVKQHSPTRAAEQISRQLGWNKDALELKGQLKLAAKPPVIQLIAHDDADADSETDTV